MVIAAAIGLFEFDDLARIYRIQRWEFWLSVVCTVGVAVFGAIPGIGIAIVIAIFEFLWDGWRPHWAVLGEPEGVEGYHDIERYPQARRIPGLVLFRWDAPLFFANAELFSERVLDAIDASPTPVRRGDRFRGAHHQRRRHCGGRSRRLEQTLQPRGIELCFAELKDPVKDKLKRFGLFAHFGENCFLQPWNPRFEATSGTRVREAAGAGYLCAAWADWPAARGLGRPRSFPGRSAVVPYSGRRARDI